MCEFGVNVGVTGTFLSLTSKLELPSDHKKYKMIQEGPGLTYVPLETDFESVWAHPGAA